MLKKIAAGVGSLSIIAGNAMAAVPTEVNTALTDMKTDGVTVATLVVVAALVVYGIKFLRRAA